MNVINWVEKYKIIAIFRDVDRSNLIETCKALYEGGIRLMEITFNQSSENGKEETYESIKMLDQALGNKVCIGAGTVMTLEQVDLAVKAGAKYIISPNFDKSVVERSVELGVVAIPGVMTPSEITNAYQAGASFAKVFPAGNFGADYIKAIKSPMSHIPLLAVGGIDEKNAKSFIEAGCLGVGIGSSLVNKELIKDKQFDALKALAVRLVESIDGEVESICEK
ncbi:bifunctional 4-hydroxy-2-oxoglutarate aldolase/2-dehydro-3-deoxy-phosphogluconate aldolase [Fusibacter sp. 3D3]|uniref:bifunctional 4-hydroxy-2-oxoglutarate aldolase/2-dehydro-3-deoxy-phosphogluconate aldolase n=1 Tax=Fusibacter sp. 3D3 TaxID=1048380 RepID=UPI000852BA95|nr:bifunctional 4-hydroxy-2-oxoglutarate aldolase/2-dehydro-3-deoxy-phosphogluconate aldolase [Fusibacter sp. 3D3]GAU75554.1 4-Hydroxy-2-oxoglutarate aldolase [Fusibacter sp. 3D3]